MCEVGVSYDCVDLLLLGEFCFLNVYSLLSVPDLGEVFVPGVDDHFATDFISLSAVIFLREEHVNAEHAVSLAYYLDEKSLK
jgi:hypothetical protein